MERKYSLNKPRIMKAQYYPPQIKQIKIQTASLICTSTITEGVYTDDPKTTDKALVKEREYDWDNEW